MACNSRFKLATSHRNAAANCVQPAANLACWLGGLLLLLILLLLLLLLLPGGGFILGSTGLFLPLHS